MVPHIGSLRALCSCFLKKVSLQLSSEQSVGDVRIMQLDCKRVPQARSRGCKSSVTITAECSRHHAQWIHRTRTSTRRTLRTCGCGRSVSSNGSLGHHGNYSRRTCRNLLSEMHVTGKQCSRNF